MTTAGEVLVLGAGPAGLWTAMTLLERHPGLGVTVVDRGDSPGGMAGSFTRGGLEYDYGSHRLHPSSAGSVLDSVRALLGDRLLERPRNGRIRLEGRFVRFPPRPVDMLLRLPPSFAAGAAFDALSAPFRRSVPPDAPFDATLRAGLGRTICARFYFPYARKLWGLPPDRIDGVQARRRVSSGSLGSMLRKVLPGAGRRRGATFFYPAGGFGEIGRAAARRIETLGGRIRLRTEVVAVSPAGGARRGSVAVSAAGSGEELPADFVFSTIPVTDLVRMLTPPPDDAVLEAASSLSWRSMVLLYLELGMRTYTPYDAHYFPGADTTFSRLSEPRNYSATPVPEDATGLCLEFPCDRGDAIWEADGDALGALAAGQLHAAGLPRPDPRAAFTRRLTHAYPVYALDHRAHLDILETAIDRIPGLVTLGRQGLFAHDNVHHAMETGMTAAGCLDPGAGWDAESWAAARRGFREHTVVD